MFFTHRCGSRCLTAFLSALLCWGHVAGVAAQEFDLDQDEPEAVWSDGTTMWVLESSPKKILAYNLTTKTRDPAKASCPKIQTRCQALDGCALHNNNDR